MNFNIIEKEYSVDIYNKLKNQGINHFLAKIYASRGIHDIVDIGYELKKLLHFKFLKNIDLAVNRIVRAINNQEKIIIIADYDADGATACAVILKSLFAFYRNDKVDFLVPNRVIDGYGINNSLVDKAISLGANLIITVDNGTAAYETIDYAQKQGIDVIVTDHHLPAKIVPECIIINPNQDGCNFPSKNLAGVGVAFYTMLALRAKLREKDYFILNNKKEFNLSSLLDIVAIGTIADLVSLDYNNRILIYNGLKRIREGQLNPGIKALFYVANRNYKLATVKDIGYAIAPRLNANGRLSDMNIAIKCLIASNDEEALIYAMDLDKINNERKNIEVHMISEAIEQVKSEYHDKKSSICIYDKDWHIGIIGIIAGRIKEKYNLPTIVFTKLKDDLIQASARSIPSINLKEVLDFIDNKYGKLIIKYGGHSMAAGITILEKDFCKFKAILDEVIHNKLMINSSSQDIYTDGILDVEDINIDNAKLLNYKVWGKNFEYPIFYDEFIVVEQRYFFNDKHRRLVLKKDNHFFQAVIFNALDSEVGYKILSTYQLNYNNWQNKEQLQIQINNWINLE